MRARFDDMSFVHDDDEVAVTNGGEAVGDDKGGLSAEKVCKRGLNGAFGHGVDGSRRLVQDQHFGRGEEHPRYGYELFLPLAQLLSVAADYGIVSAFEGAYEVIEASGARGEAYLLFRRFLYR